MIGSDNEPSIAYELPQFTSAGSHHLSGPLETSKCFCNPTFTRSHTSFQKRQFLERQSVSFLSGRKSLGTDSRVNGRSFLEFFPKNFQKFQKKGRSYESRAGVSLGCRACSPPQRGCLQVSASTTRPGTCSRMPQLNLHGRKHCPLPVSGRVISRCVEAEEASKEQGTGDDPAGQVPKMPRGPRRSRSVPHEGTRGTCADAGGRATRQSAARGNPGTEIYPPPLCASTLLCERSPV